MWLLPALCAGTIGITTITGSFGNSAGFVLNSSSTPLFPPPVAMIFHPRSLPTWHRTYTCQAALLPSQHYSLGLW